MRFLSLLVLLVTRGACAQELRYASLGDFRLTSGETIRDCRIGYRTYGRLNPEKSNAIVFPTWFTGTTEHLSAFVGKGKMLDPEKYFVVTVDALGDGVSSSPSNSTVQPRMSFPKFTIRDMVRTQHQLVTGTLGIAHLRAVIGISMGGMQTFEWAVAYPGMLDKAIPIVGSPQLTAYDLLLWTAEHNAITGDREWNNGDYTRPPALRAKADIHQFALTSPQHRARETKRGEFAKFLKGAEAASFDPNNWLRQLEAMMAHDIAAGFDGSLEKSAAQVTARVLVIAALQDHMVNPGPALEFARLLVAPVVELTGDCGHLAVGCETGKVNAAVERFLDH